MKTNTKQQKKEENEILKLLAKFMKKYNLLGFTAQWNGNYFSIRVNEIKETKQ